VLSLSAIQSKFSTVGQAFPVSFLGPKLLKKKLTKTFVIVCVWYSDVTGVMKNLVVEPLCLQQKHVSFLGAFNHRKKNSYNASHRSVALE